MIGSGNLQQPVISTCSPWATVADVCSPCDDYAFDQSMLTESLQAASDVLYELSGRKFPGSCQTTVRPCSASCRGRTARSCGCGTRTEISLGGYPITGIVAVTVDGVVLDASQYRVDDWRWLVRLADADGSNPGWPACQRIDLPTTEADTFEVTYTYGQEPPQLGVTAAAALGCQFALACQPETVGECRLPQRVTSITRQGVTTVVLDSFDFLEEGKTGVYDVDLFIRTYNPYKRTRRNTVYDPAASRSVRRTTTP